MPARGRAGGIGHGRRREQQPGAVTYKPSLPHVSSHSHDLLRPAGNSGGNRRQLAAVARLVARRLGGHVVRGERGDSLVVGSTPYRKSAPHASGGRHLDEILDVDRREHGLARDEAARRRRSRHRRSARPRARARRRAGRRGPRLRPLRSPRRARGQARPSRPAGSSNCDAGDRRRSSRPAARTRPSPPAVRSGTPSTAGMTARGGFRTRGERPPRRSSPRAAASAPPPGRPLEHLLKARTEADRREALPREHVLDRVVLGKQPPVGLRVGAREARDLLAGALEAPATSSATRRP